MSEVSALVALIDSRLDSVFAMRTAASSVEIWAHFALGTALVGFAAVAVDCRRIGSYERHRPKATTLYAVVRDNGESLYAAGQQVSTERRSLGCGRLCRGFAGLKCSLFQVSAADSPWRVTARCCDRDEGLHAHQ